MSTEEPGWGGYTEPTRNNGGGGSNPPPPPPPPQDGGVKNIAQEGSPGGWGGTQNSSGSNDLGGGGSHTSYDNAGNPTTIYTDRLGNVHSLQDYSRRGGGRYDTVIGGFHEGYAGSGYRRSAYTELQQPGVKTAVLAAANADPRAALSLERAGIIEIQRYQPEQIEPQQEPIGIPEDKRWFYPANYYDQSSKNIGVRKSQDYVIIPKYGKMVPKSSKVAEEQQAWKTKFNTADIKPSNTSIDFAQEAQGYAEEIRAFTIDAPLEVKESPGWKLGGIIKKSIADFVDFIGIAPVNAEIYARTAVNKPSMLPEMTAYSVVKAGEGMSEAAQTDPIQFVSDNIVFGYALKGAGKVASVGTTAAKGAVTTGLDLAKDAASIKITGANPEFPGGGIINEHPFTPAESQIRTASASNFVGPTLKDPLVDISNKGIGNIQNIIGKTEGVKRNSFDEEIYMSMKEPDPKPIYSNPGDMAGMEPEIIGFEPLPPEGNIKVEIAGGKVEANRLIDNIASGLRESGDNIKVKGSEIFSDNGLYGKERKVFEVDYFNKFKETTLGPKKFRQPEINNLETKDITAMPFENVNLNVGDIRPAQTGLESLKQVQKPSLEGLKQVHKGSLEGLKPVEKKGFEGLKKVEKPGLKSLKKKTLLSNLKEKMVSSAVDMTGDLPVKFVDVSPGEAPVYRGLSLEVGRTGQPLIGKTPKGWKIGTPEFNKAEVKELYGEAFESKSGYPAHSPTELAIARKNIIENYDPLNKAIAEDSMQLREMTFGTESKFLSNDLVFDEPLKSHGLKPETIKNVKNWMQNQDIVVTGSVAQKSQMRGLPHRELHDIDFYIENPQGKAQELLNVIERTEPGKVFFDTPGRPTLITKEGGTIFDIHPPEGLADISPEGLSGSASHLKTAGKYVHFAFKYEDPVKIGGIKATSLSEQATRKMGSSIGLRENEVMPAGHRVKDIADHLTIEPALIESQEMGLFSGLRAGKIARERAILSRLEQNWMEKSKTFTPEQRANFMNLIDEGRPDLKQVIYVSKSIRPKSDSVSLSKMAGVGAFESRNNNIASQYKIDKSIRESSMMKNLEKSSGSKSSGGSRSKSGGGSKPSSFGIKPSGSVFGSGGSNSHGSSPPSSPSRGSPPSSPNPGSPGSPGRSGSPGSNSIFRPPPSETWNPPPLMKQQKGKPVQDDLHNIQKAIKKSFRTVRIAPIMEPTTGFGQQKGRKSRRRR